MDDAGRLVLAADPSVAASRKALEQRAEQTAAAGPCLSEQGVEAGFQTAVEQLVGQLVECAGQRFDGRLAVLQAMGEGAGEFL